jgi:3',5'-cyclic AMP phosphodiesterase CpdA
MNTLTGQRDAVLATLQQTIDAFQQDGPLVQQIMTARLQPATEAQRQAMRAQMLQQLQQAYAAEAAAPQAQPWYAPQNSVIALVQSAMEQHLGPTVGESQHRAIVDADGIPILERFGPTDPGWIEVVIDALGTLLEGKANFITHNDIKDFMFAIPEQCTIALVADWGGDNDSAGDVRDQIVAQHPDYVIHLGDIYYAGQENETRSFLSHWPSAGQKRSFALNGNHEMYSGGHAYFEKVLPAFLQPASYFGLYNHHWQFLGVDTAFLNHQLTSPEDARLDKQFAWIVDKLKDPARSSIVLSHHQPFSAFQPEHDDASRLRNDITKLYDAVGPDPIFGWFFGHEHRCTIYDDSYSSYRARLIGHGCIPHLPPDVPTDPPIPFRATNTTVRPDGSGDAMSGFALVTLDGSVIQIVYINEDGTVWNRETWTGAQTAAPAA